jgi:hypothetical protein
MSRKFTRRQFIKASAVGIAAAGSVMVAGKIISGSADPDLPHPYPVMPDKKPVIPASAKPPLFFNDHQYRLVASLASLIVPTDKDPGATEAGAADYIDKMVSYSEIKQKQYAKGLEWIEDVSKKQYGKYFIDLTVEEQIDLLIAIDEADIKRNIPVSGLIGRIDRKIHTLWDEVFGVGDSSRFFKTIREDVFFGYYSNPISWKVIGYFGPPQPVGYPDYAEPPSSDNYIFRGLRQIYE